MKKVLLVTLQSINIGNRLQNYALQEVIKQMGFCVYSPYYKESGYENFGNYLKSIAKIVMGFCGVKKYKKNYLRIARKKVFRIFNNAYINNQFKIKMDDIYENNYDDFECAVVGSDQVWHKWTEYKKELEYFYLDFIPYDKRIAYAPSFGFDEFDKDDYDIHISGIKGIKYLSCREKNGSELIKRHLNIDVPVVLDPTLLLSKSEWETIIKKPVNTPKEEYILCYFLGSKRKIESYIEKIASSLNCKIVSIFDEDDIAYYNVSPDEFLYLIKNAKFVCTDSFHACVFSVVFERQFVVFERDENGFQNMFKRIEDLLEILGLHDCIGEREKLILDISWEDVYIKLGKKKEESFEFLYSTFESI